MKLTRDNKLIIGLCVAASILIIKLFNIQIIEDKYKLSAENNTPDTAYDACICAIADEGVCVSVASPNQITPMEL